MNQEIANPGPNPNPNPNPNPRALISFAVSGLAENTRVNYSARLVDYLSFLERAGASDAITYATVKAYKERMIRQGLGASSIRQALSAIKRLALELARAGRLPREEAQAIAEIEGIPQRGQASHLWLSMEEARLLLDAPDVETVKGLRDVVALGLLVGCALRREETARLTWGHIKRRGNATVISNIRGKGNRTRTIPLPPWLLPLLARWRDVVGGEDADPLLQQVDRWDNLRGGGITPRTIYNIVAEYAEAIGVEDLAPHDLRRTWARLAYDAAPERLEQISLILGHESLRTTEIYMGLDSVDLDNPLYVDV